MTKKLEQSKKITKELEDKILKYQDKFETMENFVDIVRKMPGMYIGPIGNQGFLNMIREILQNALDEFLRSCRGESICTMVYLSYDERTHTVIVEDNGNGIPHKVMVNAYTKSHTSTNYTKVKGQYTSGMHGLGAKVTAALTSKMEVESCILGKGKKLTLIDGAISNPKNPLEDIDCDGRQGTRVTFIPEYDVLGPISLKGETIVALASKLIQMVGIGAKLLINYIDINGNAHSKLIENTEGILTIIKDRTTSPLINPIYINGDNGTTRAEIMFTYDTGDMDIEDIVAFSNFCPTLSGTHIDGFIDGVSKFFRDYMNKIYLVKNSKITITNADVRTGLKAVINAAHLEPVFTGQAKEILSNEDMKVFVKDITLEALNEWVRANPNDIGKVCKYLKEVAEIRMKSEGGKSKLSDNYKKSVLSDLPAKYVPASGKEDLEFIITEGDSALGSAKDARCHKRQALFPIRGKLPNALTTNPKDYINNAEISGIAKILDCGIGKNFDISRLKFSKIIAATDADSDGAHIHMLLLSLFLIYMTPIVTNGFLYKAVPPLYGIKKGKKFEYFTRDIDLVNYVQDLFVKSNQITRLDGINFTPNQLFDLFVRNRDYIYDLETISSRYALNPKLLELALMQKAGGSRAIKNAIEDNFRFMQVQEKKNILVGTGLIDGRYQTLVLNERLYNDSSKISHYLNERNAGEILFKLNGEVASLYDIMKAFENSTPNNINRYKGLGEMNSEQLAESTIHPDGNRVLIQYTAEDIKKEIEQIRYLQSNTKELFNRVSISKKEL